MRHLVEYMINDWIMAEGNPVQIAAVHQKKIGYHRYPGRLSWVRLDCIKQIPLTAEFLLKNEFVLVEKNCYEWKNNQFHIILEDKLNGIWDMMVENCDPGYLKKIIIEKLLKVHHLQHEFILGGIKKDFIIENKNLEGI